MIRHLHPTDSPRLLVFKQEAGADEAVGITQAATGTARTFSAVRYAGVALSPRAWESVWVETQRVRIQALLRAGPRSGPLAWEIRELYLRRGNIQAALDVLEQIAIPAGSAGARRVLIRLAGDSPIFDLARKAGFLPVTTEVLYMAQFARDPMTAVGRAVPMAELRERTAEDSDALYRLYCATTPVQARLALGQTREEWASAVEKSGRRLEEMVLDDASGRVACIVQWTEIRAGRLLNVAWHASGEFSADALLVAALDGARPDAPVFSLVPEYASGPAGLLERAGFAPVRRFELLVKPLAEPVMETRRAVAAVG